METEQQNTVESKPKRKLLRVIKYILIAVVGIILLLFFMTPLVLSSSGGTRFLVGRINASVDGQVQMDDFSVGWLRGVKLTGLSYADSAGNTSVKVRRIETQPKYLALLGGKVELGKTIIDTPQVYLKVPAMQEPAAEAERTVSKTEKTAPAEKTASAEKTVSVKKSEKKSDVPAVFPVNQIELEVIDGSATVELIGDASQTVSFTNIASNVNLAPAGQTSTLRMSMNVIGQAEPSTLSAEGNVTTDKTGWTLKDGAFDIRIDKLQLASLKPLFALAGQSVDIAGELNADASIAIAQNALEQVRANVTVTNFSHGAGDQRTVFEKPITVMALAGQEGEVVKIEQLRLDSEFFNAACTGTTEALDYKIDANLAQTQRLIGQFTDLGGLSMQGAVAMGGKVLMKDQKVTATGNGTVKQLVIKKESVSTPTTDITMDFDCTVDQAENQLRLGSANLAASSLGDVKVANLILPMGDQADKTISLDAAAKMDLAAVWLFVQVFADVPKDMQISGMLNSALKATTTGSTVQVLTDKTQIDKLKIIPKEGEPFIQDRVTLTGDILLDTARQTIDVRSFDLQGAAGESLIKITKGQLKKKISDTMTQMNGDFEVQYDWQTLSAFASVYLPQGLSVKGTRKDTFHFNSQFPTDQPELMKANLNAAAAIGFDQASFQGLNFGPTEVKLNIAQGQAAIDIPDADVNGGKVRFAADINLAEEPMILRLRKSPQAGEVKIVENVKIDDVISANLLQYLNPVFARGTNVTGTANLSCSTLAIPLGGGTPNDIDLTGSVGLTDVRLNSPLLGLFSAALQTEGMDLFAIPASAFTVKNGLVRYDDMPVVFGSDFTLHFGGQIGLTDQSLAMTVKVPSGGSNIAVPLSGTLAKPKLDMSKFIELQGKQLIEQEVKKQLDRLFK